MFFLLSFSSVFNFPRPNSHVARGKNGNFDSKLSRNIWMKPSVK